MSAVPAEIAGIGSTLQKMRVSPGFDPLKAGVGPEEYFVLSRIDGVQSLRDVLLTTGLPVDRAIAIVQRLRSIGALLAPGETAPPTRTTGSQPSPPPSSSGVPERVAPSSSGRTLIPPSRITGSVPTIRAGSAPPSAPAAARAPTPNGNLSSGVPQAPMPTTGSSSVSRRVAAPGPTSSSDPIHDLSLPGMTPVEMAALREPGPLDDVTRRRVLAMARLADGRDPWALLGLYAGADARQLKRAYFKLSKEIHPDRYFGQALGSFASRLPMVFEALSRAYARLTNPEKAQRAPEVERGEQPQTPQEYAAELFERACQLEVSGEHLDAMKLFSAAVRVDPQPRYLRRAASCALAAGQPRSAVEYAKKAHSLTPNDPSAARLLAAAFRSAGKLSDAEEVLVMAMAMKSENDVLTAELRHDLAEVRRLLAHA